MNARLNTENVVRTAKRIVGLVGLASLALLCAGTTWAQSQPVQPDSAASRRVLVAPESASKLGPSAVTPAAEQNATQSLSGKQGVAEGSPARLPVPKGQHEGITVHGHWVIDVRNSDGKFVSRTEFENALSPGFPFPFSNYALGNSVPVWGGAAFLSAVLSGQAEVTPENWAILLEGPGGLSGAGNAPCTAGAAGEGYGACFLFPATPDAVNYDFQAPVCNGGVSGGPGYFCNLQVSPLGTSPNFTGFLLSGSAVATQQGTVTSVTTMNFGACGPTNSLPNCALYTSLGWAALTARTLDGNTPAGAAAGDPNPVAVSAGQTIQVSVAISFQ
jgi:hypothetical protein